MSDEGTKDDLELVMTMIEGIMQTQELVVMSLLQNDAVDVPSLKARLEHAIGKKDLRLGSQLPLLRMLDVLNGKSPPPPRWRPRLIPGGVHD